MIFITVLYASQVALCYTICDVTTVQLSNNGTVHIFHKMFTFIHENTSSPLLLYLGMFNRPKIIVHAFMIELDQPNYWYLRKHLCTKSMESCSLVISLILAEFCPERERHTKLCIISYLIIKYYQNYFAQTFTVGFINLLSAHPIHIVVWGNFPFKVKV